MKDVVLPRAGDEYKARGKGRCIVGRTFTNGRAGIKVEFTEQPLLIVREWRLTAFLRTWRRVNPTGGGQ